MFATTGRHDTDVDVLRVRRANRRCRRTPRSNRPVTTVARRSCRSVRSAASTSPSSDTSRSRSQSRGPMCRGVAQRATSPLESGFQRIEPCWNSPGVRLRGAPVPSAATTYTCFGRSNDPALVVELAEESLDLSRCLPALVLRVVALVRGATGECDPATVRAPTRSLTPSFIVAMVRVSPGDAIGKTCSVLSPDFAPRFDEKARRASVGAPCRTAVVVATGDGTRCGRSVGRGQPDLRRRSCSWPCRPD